MGKIYFLKNNSSYFIFMRQNQVYKGLMIQNGLFTPIISLLLQQLICEVLLHSKVLDE